jgi:hypothetical protein
MGSTNTLDTLTTHDCKIVAVDRSTKRIEGVLKVGKVVQVSVYATDPLFRWPKVGESWMVRQDNGHWILDGIWQD